MGPVEYVLHHELCRRWLIWRDEAVHSGTTDPADLRAALVRRQREWEGAPHPGHGGRTVVEVVAEERRDANRTVKDELAARLLGERPYRFAQVDRRSSVTNPTSVFTSDP